MRVAWWSSSPVATLGDGNAAVPDVVAGPKYVLPGAQAHRHGELHLPEWTWTSITPHEPQRAHRLGQEHVRELLLLWKPCKIVKFANPCYHTDMATDGFVVVNLFMCGASIGLSNNCAFEILVADVTKTVKPA
jgi:hypothetical protein